MEGPRACVPWVAGDLDGTRNNTGQGFCARRFLGRSRHYYQPAAARLPMGAASSPRWFADCLRWVRRGWVHSQPVGFGHCVSAPENSPGPALLERMGTETQRRHSGRGQTGDEALGPRHEPSAAVPRPLGGIHNRRVPQLLLATSSGTPCEVGLPPAYRLLGGNEYSCGSGSSDHHICCRFDQGIPARLVNSCSYFCSDRPCVHVDLRPFENGSARGVAVAGRLDGFGIRRHRATISGGNPSEIPGEAATSRDAL